MPLNAWTHCDGSDCGLSKWLMKFPGMTVLGFYIWSCHTLDCAAYSVTSCVYTTESLRTTAAVCVAVDEES